MGWSRALPGSKGRVAEAFVETAFDARSVVIAMRSGRIAQLPIPVSHQGQAALRQGAREADRLRGGWPHPQIQRSHDQGQADEVELQIEKLREVDHLADADP